MNLFKAYFLLFLIVTACQNQPQETTHFVRKKVFVIREEVPEIQEAKTDTSYLEVLFRSYGMVNVSDLDSSIKVNLRYADTANFLHRSFYDGLRHAYFPCQVAIGICNVQHFLKKFNPNYSLLILDATRPLHIQQLMWDSLQMPPDKKFNYLAPPNSISLHNYGCAADVSIFDFESQKELDMGTSFDEFTRLSEPAYEWHHLSTGAITEEQINNRKLLRRVMKLGGFNSITSEWWHFNFCGKAEAAEKFQLVK